MTEKAIAFTKNSFTISGRGIIVELQHFQQGLEKGTLLTSEQSGLSWEVKARIHFDHAEGKQLIYENESTEWILLKFNKLAERNKSLEVIQTKEADHIFQYLLKPVGHTEKPLESEGLIIKYT